jgi:hypothetical protein
MDFWDQVCGTQAGARKIENAIDAWTIGRNFCVTMNWSAFSGQSLFNTGDNMHGSRSIVLESNEGSLEEFVLLVCVRYEYCEL